MAKKKSPGVPSNSRPPARAAQSHAHRFTWIAHPRLVHGFLVRLVPLAQLAPGAARPPGATIAGAKARTVRLAESRHEGPADDTTFH